jgi:hypothetical protein
MSSRIVQLSAHAINLENEGYRLSRYSDDSRLLESIASHGILEMPLLQHTDDEWIILSGHRRIGAARDLETEPVFCEVVDAYSPERIKQQAIKRSFQGRIGPAGKLRLFGMLMDREERELEPIASELSFPRKLLYSRGEIASMLDIPGPLLRYADSREMGFRLWQEMAKLSKQWISFLSYSIEGSTVSNSQFRKMLDLVRDLDRQSRVPPEIPDDGPDARCLLDTLMKMRFPELTGMREKATELADKSVAHGGTVSWPETFEGDRIELRLPLSRREGIQKLDSMIGSIDRDRIRELLEMF